MKFSTLAAAALFALAGCAHQAAPAASATTTTSCACCGGKMQGGSMMKQMCPMNVAGTTATAADVEGGAALELKTSSGDVADLRARVHHMAEMHEHAGGCPMMAGMTTPSTATVEDVDGGARIVFEPKDPAQLAALRENVRAHAQQMHAGCPMPH